MCTSKVFALTRSVAGAGLIVVIFAAQANGLLVTLSCGTLECVFDDSTNLEWLQPELTEGLSFNQVTPLLGPGGSFEGFRHANQAEWDAFRAELIGLPANGAFGSPYNCAGSQCGTKSQISFEGPGSVAFPSVALDTHGYTGFGGTPRYTGNPQSQANTGPDETFETGGTFGHALVHLVPEPSTGLLTALGVAALLALRKRR